MGWRISHERNWRPNNRLADVTEDLDLVVESSGVSGMVTCLEMSYSMVMHWSILTLS